KKMKGQVGIRFSHCISKLILFIVIFLMGCSEEIEPSSALIEVRVSSATERKIMSWDTYQGRFQSPEVSKVLPRVNGLLVKSPFLEGSMVEMGSVLFEVDDRLFLAEYLSKEAYYQKSQAIFKQKQTKFNRFK